MGPSRSYRSVATNPGPRTRSRGARVRYGEVGGRGREADRIEHPAFEYAIAAALPAVRVRAKNGCRLPAVWEAPSRACRSGYPRVIRRAARFIARGFKRNGKQFRQDLSP